MNTNNSQEIETIKPKDIQTLAKE